MTLNPQMTHHLSDTRGLQLQFGEHSASTKNLTQSFGWTTMDAFTQHDVQELNRILSDKLEEKMKVSLCSANQKTLPHWKESQSMQGIPQRCLLISVIQSTDDSAAKRMMLVLRRHSDCRERKWREQ